MLSKNSDLPSEYDPINEGEDYTSDIYADIERNLLSYSGFISMLKELLQNSDDSTTDLGKQIEVEIRFLKDKFVIKNNTMFTDRDWGKITTIGSRNKSQETEQTGRFGIGFTAVYKICDKAAIHSNNQSKVVDLTRPSNHWYKINKKYSEEEVTEFEFFWRFEDTETRQKIGADVITPKDIKEFIKQTNEELSRDIHFLKHITKIKLYDEDKLLQDINIVKDFKKIKQDIDREQKTITIDGNTQTYILYHKKLDSYFQTEYENRIARARPLLLSIAINTSSLNPGRIFCTLPTRMETGFLYDINADFQPDPNRKDIILDEDDKKGIYNDKILNFVPELLFEIINDLKQSLSVDMFYRILSVQENTDIEDIHKNIFMNLVEMLKESNSEIILINNNWHKISDSKLMDMSTLISFLKRIEYPIIPEEHLKFADFFKELDISKFDIDDLIYLIKDNVPFGIDFTESCFNSIDELKSVFEYFETQHPIEHHKKEIKGLNIFLTEDGCLVSANDCKILKVPEKLSLIKNDLPITLIDGNIYERFQNVLNILDIQLISPEYLINILYDESSHTSYPCAMSEAQKYLNTIEKIKSILSFLEPLLITYDKNKKDKNQIYIDGSLVHPGSEEFNKYKSLFDKIDELPLLVDEENIIYPIENDSVFDITSKTESAIAKKHGLKCISKKIRDLLSNHFRIKKLTLKTIVDLVEQECETNGESNPVYLEQIYRILLEKDKELDDSLIERLKHIPIFQNNNHEFCPLETDGKSLMFSGEYTDPIGIKEIINEDTIKKIKGFKESVLKNIFNMKSLTFELFIKTYFEEIFEDEKIDVKKKLRLVDDLNEQFIKLEKKSEFQDIKENILKYCKIIYCQDKQFHESSEDIVFFKSKEIDELLGNDYLWPDFKNIEKYEHMLKRLGVKQVIRPKQLVTHICKLADGNVSTETTNKLRELFIHINDRWDDFEDKENFKELADIPWLPAVGDTKRLYKPSELFTWITKEKAQNTKDILNCLSDINYLDVRDIHFKKKGRATLLSQLISIFGLTTVGSIPLDLIIKNLKIASDSCSIIKADKIYEELNKRSWENDISELKDFPSICIKYKEEEKPRFFLPSEVFRKDEHKRFGWEYIGYLDSRIVSNCKNLLESLDVKDEPDIRAIIILLEKIEEKYSNKDNSITDTDKKIISSCLQLLNDSHTKIDEDQLWDLKKIHMLINEEGILIRPSEAILADRPSLQNEFKKTLKDYLIGYKKEFLDLFECLEIARLSEIISKELQIKPDEENLKTDNKTTSRIKWLSCLMERIKTQKKDFEKELWADIDDEIVVLVFPNLEIKRFVYWNGQTYFSREKGSCYIDNKNRVITRIYLKEGGTQNRKSLVQELFEELHPQLKSDFRSVLLSLFERESLDEMGAVLTELDYPLIDERKEGEVEDEKTVDISEGVEFGEKDVVKEEPEIDIEKEKKRLKKSKIDKLKPFDTAFEEYAEEQDRIIQSPVQSPAFSIDDDHRFEKDEVEEIKKNDKAEKKAARKSREKFVKKRGLRIVREAYYSYENNLSDKKEVKEYLYSAYNGKCQICENTFLKNNGRNFFVASLLIPKEKSGPDTVSNSLCLCSTCFHKKYAADFKIDYDDFKEKVSKLGLLEDLHLKTYKEFFRTNGFDESKSGLIKGIKIKVCGEEEYIKFNPEHLYRLISWWDIKS